MDRFSGSICNPTSKFATRAVDWIAFASYVVPILFVPSLANNVAAAVMSIVRFTQFTQQRRLTDADLQMMDEDLMIWNTYIENLLKTNTIKLSFITPNHHTLLHVTDAIRELGPMHSYSCRGMERSIGGMKKLIRSTRDSGMNARKIMLDMAAMNYIERRSVAVGNTMAFLLGDGTPDDYDNGNNDDNGDDGDDGNNTGSGDDEDNRSSDSDNEWKSDR
ncbi:hypothetical protein BC941DRAFT_456942 [Chlamydoabsidia padenii]|nr:hypothetical protein BC941DRAFT_456942 [Chlamydoabsidia padenii]